jgi:predicted PurR-regulated permease PerM
MKKTVAISFTIAAFILGLITGGLVVAAKFNTGVRQLIRHFTQTEIQLRISKVNTETESLGYLRSNQTTNALKSLEDDLEMNLSELDVFTMASNQLAGDSWNMEVLQKAKDYREQFPYGTNAFYKTTETHLFTVLNSQTNH